MMNFLTEELLLHGETEQPYGGTAPTLDFIDQAENSLSNMDPLQIRIISYY